MKKLVLILSLFSSLFILTACDTQVSYDIPTSSTSQTTKLPEPPVIDWQKTYANENIYTYYYGQTCTHCKKVDDYFKASGIDQRIHITTKEVQMNRVNSAELMNVADELGIPTSQVGTPFITVNEPDGNRYALIWEDEVMNHFKELETQIRSTMAE